MDCDNENDGSYEDEEVRTVSHGSKKSNILPLWGNERTMNLNALILTNIQSSHYFKVNLYELKTYHEVIDEIYYKVNHLEPWEKGSRKTAGQTGMCGGVRGVGAGGIVSTAYCLLYKLFTLKLTRKQVNGLITHPDSPYIRALGFMYIRYTQPPADLWDWYDEYLEDPEEMDVKAGGGQVMAIGNILKNFLCKLEWFSTLFPRIPVPIQQKLEKMMNERFPPPATVAVVRKPSTPVGRHIPDGEAHFGQAEKVSRMRGGDTDTDKKVFSREHDDRTTRTAAYSREHDDRTTRPVAYSREHDDRTTRPVAYSREHDDRTTKTAAYSREHDDRTTKTAAYSREHDDRTTRRGYSRDRDNDRRTSSKDGDKTRDSDRRVYAIRNSRERDSYSTRDGDRRGNSLEKEREKLRLERDREREIRDRDRKDRDRDYSRDSDKDRDKRDRSRRDSPVKRRDVVDNRQKRERRASPIRRRDNYDDRVNKERDRERDRDRNRY